MSFDPRKTLHGWQPQATPPRHTWPQQYAKTGQFTPPTQQYVSYGYVQGHYAYPAPAEPAPMLTIARPVDVRATRVRFIKLTYLHLLAAILAFAGLEYLLMTNPFLVERVSVPFVQFALGGRWNWGVVLGVFMVVSWIADFWASHATSRATQYLGLVAYTVAEAPAGVSRR